MGFSHVLTAPVFMPGRSGDIFLTADHERVHAVLAEGRPSAADEWLAELAAACRDRDLSLLLDLVIDRVAEDAVAPDLVGDCFNRPDGAEALDPRRLRNRGALVARFDDARCTDILTQWWAGRIERLVRAGVAGFRCLDPGQVPPRVWRQLAGAARAEQPDSLFLADTPGTPLAAIAALAGCGFDYLFSSVAWWDCRAGWLVDEHEALCPVAPLVGFPERPFGKRLAAAAGPFSERAARRALNVAAATGAGLLVPMGFEHGATEPLDPIRVRPASGPDEPSFDLTREIARVNALIARGDILGRDDRLGILTGPDAAATAILRMDKPDVQRVSRATLVVINPDLGRPTSIDGGAIAALPTGFSPFRDVEFSKVELLGGRRIRLEPGEVRLFSAETSRPVLREPQAEDITAAIAAPRIVIADVTPSIDGGRFAAKRLVGSEVTVEADIFIDGHDKLAARLLWRAVDEDEWQSAPMAFVINDRWQGHFPVTRLGRHVFTVEAWRDAYGSWRDEVEKKRAAGQPLAVEIEEGTRHLREAAEGKRTPDGTKLARILADLTGSDEAKLDRLLSDEVATLARACDPRAFLSRHPVEVPVLAERRGAGFASWYELFPRSQTDDVNRHGTFADVVGRLPAIRDMGFDVLYFPPIHPIGRTNRKGRNNALTAGPDDPGSPYAIGGDEGGHDAIHPALGTLDDFRRLRDAAFDHGIELALDFAIQCSPDHPWLKQHPEWFAWRPDGSLRYAENPPKKYEDIVNVDFYAEAALPDLWLALRDVVLFWAGEGVRLFRVDNPHTKPLPFWEWLIADVSGRYPDAVFLSEAFTRPKMMYRLAKAGFSQSYTYFTWRNDKRELSDYLTELTQTEVKDFFRPHFFVNTPDINPVFLQQSGRPGFLIRAALAATLSGLWGVYSGFELCEAAALPGREEYRDSEKYEIKPRDWSAPGNIIAEITRLNRIRKANPALQSHLGLAFYSAFDDAILYYGKTTPLRDNTILVAVNLDPHAARTFSFELPLWEWGLPDDGALVVEDLMNDREFVLAGKNQMMTLDPGQPFAIWRARPVGGR
ncbi:maltotransferase domain-containing protein [Chelatococcus sp. GCM10030263]|uniref:alpha-1,4-glucan--maltose-1-phosphate maltosyltransferase n=1 Tax=Chelatococcus sp. GCM10030263 TaxID=3273387 RepID=UPI0036131A0F